MSYNYSFPDFLKYAQDAGSNLRVEGQIFWVNTMPIPTELVKNLFFDAPKVLSLFLNHLFTSVIASLGELRYGNISASNALPTDSNTEEELENLKSYYREFSVLQNFVTFQNEVIRLSGIDYATLSIDAYVESITHKGKKYERFYYPDSIKNLILEYFPSVGDILTRKNGDFFGNPLCDKVNIYRNGYNDAMSSIFNKYFDFKFDYFPCYDPSQGSHGQEQSRDIINIGELIISNSLRGNLWEPRLSHDGKVDILIDRTHAANDLSDKDKYELLLLALARGELDIYDERTKEILEHYRYKVSKYIANFASSVSKEDLN